jgi:hypothetical protein
MKRVLTFILGVALACSAFAAEKANLYAAEVAVTGQSSAERERALPLALQQVLVKVSGDAHVLESKPVQSALTQAEKWVLAYRYAMVDSKLFLHVKFDPQAVDGLLTQAGETVWQDARSPLLIWLEYSSEAGNTIIGSEATGGWPALVQQQAGLRGVSLLLPAMDLADQEHITSKAIEKPDLELIRKASARYSSPMILVGRLLQKGPANWQASWTLLQNQQSSDWVGTGADPQTVFITGVNKAIDTLAAAEKNQIKSSDKQSISIIVTNVNTIKAYADVSKYLSALFSVSDVKPQSVNADRAVFVLNVAGGARALQQMVGRDDVLSQVDAESSSSESELYYRWSP